jgi:hypothetical protein
MTSPTTRNSAQIYLLNGRIQPLPWPLGQSFWIGFVCEDAVHDRRAAADRGDDHVAVDGLRDVGGLVAYCVADVLDRDAVVAHDRDGGVPSFVGVPVADAGPLGHLAEPVIEPIGRVHLAVLVAEDEVVVLPCFAGREPFRGLAGLVGLERGDRALGERE